MHIMQMNLLILISLLCSLWASFWMGLGTVSVVFGFLLGQFEGSLIRKLEDRAGTTLCTFALLTLLTLLTESPIAFRSRKKPNVCYVIIQPSVCRSVLS